MPEFDPAQVALDQRDRPPDHPARDGARHRVQIDSTQFDASVDFLDSVPLEVRSAQ